MGRHIVQHAQMTRVTIPAGEEPAAIRATLEELAKHRWNLAKWRVTDETTVREAVSHASTADELEAMRTITLGEPALALAFYRHVPAKSWNKKEWVGGLPWSMALTRGRVAAGVPSSILLPRELAHATAEELAAIVAALLSDEIHGFNVEGEDAGWLPRVFGPLDDASLDALWAKQTNIEWLILPALSDAQVMGLWSRVEPQKNGAGAIRFEMLRRGLYDTARLERDLELFDGGMAMWSLFAPPPDPDWSKRWSHSERLRALIRACENGQAFLPRFRAWHEKQRPHFTDPNMVQRGAMFVFALVSSDDAIAWLAKLLNDKSATFRKGGMAESMVKGLGDGLAATKDGEAILGKLGKQLKGKVLGDIIALAKTRLANNRTQLGGLAAVEIAWGETTHAEALRLLETARDPYPLVDAAFAKDDAVGHLNALYTGALFEHHREHAGKGRPDALRLVFLERAIRALDASWTSSTPDGAALKKLIGEPRYKAERRFAEALRFIPVNWREMERFVVDVAVPILSASENPQVRLWLETLVARTRPELIESSHARVVRLAAALADTGETVRHGLLVKTKEKPGPTTVNRLYGPPIGVDEHRWPTFRGKKMRHAMTVETRLFAPLVQQAYAARGVEAVAVFLSSLMEHEAFGPGGEHARIVELSAADLAKGGRERAETSDEGAETSDVGVALEAVSCALPKAVFAGGKKKDARLVELRGVLDRDDVLMVSRASPRWVQSPQPAGTFLFDVGGPYASAINLGDSGRLFVFADTAFTQSG